jgi:RNA polymerase sigma factor (TIGR02999 family)
MAHPLGKIRMYKMRAEEPVSMEEPRNRFSLVTDWNRVLGFPLSLIFKRLLWRDFDRCIDIADRPYSGSRRQAIRLSDRANQMSDTTKNIRLALSGDTMEVNELFPQVYDELRKLARARLAKVPPNQTLQATCLVHEAWLRLSEAQTDAENWKNRRHFYGAAAEAMRRILIEHVRRRNAAKRGSGQENEPFEESRIVVKADDDELLAVHEGLEQLALQDATSAEVVKLRYFIGMSVKETAETLDLSTRSVNRCWTFARAWLKTYIAQTS